MKKNQTKEQWSQIHNTYNETKSIRKTAEIVGLSKSGVEYILKTMGVERYPRIRSGKENSSRKAIKNKPKDHPSQKVRDSDLMNKLYIEQRLSLPEISKIIGCSSSTVRTGILQCGIKLRTRTEGLKGKPRPKAQGENHRDWKGGITGWRKLSRGRLNSIFVRPIMERDNFTCQWCGSLHKLVAHHHKRSFMQIVKIAKSKEIYSDSMNTVNLIVSEHKLEDGITLCKDCHDSYHKENGK